MKRLIVVVLLSSAATASAGSVLLASYNEDASSGGGGGPILGNQVQFVLQLPTSPPFGPPVDPNVGVGAGQTWASGSTGSTLFNRHEDPAVASFASFASDGVDAWIGIYTPWGGYVERESDVFGRAPDLVGYELNDVELVVHFVEVVPLPELNGSMVHWNVTYNFYGTPIPEPITVSLLCIGGMVRVLSGQLRRSRSVGYPE